MMKRQTEELVLSVALATAKMKFSKPKKPTKPYPVPAKTMIQSRTLCALEDDSTLSIKDIVDKFPDSKLENIIIVMSIDYDDYDDYHSNYSKIVEETEIDNPDYDKQLKAHNKKVKSYEEKLLIYKANKEIFDKNQDPEKKKLKKEIASLKAKLQRMEK